MMLKPLVILLSVLGVGCSSSNDDSSDMNLDDQPNVTEPGGETIQFSDPDLNGSSDLARLSYPVVRDLSRELVTGAYLDIYDEVDIAVGQLIVEAAGGQDAFQNGEITEGEVQASFVCPEGGAVRVSYTDRNGPTGIFTGSFANCALVVLQLDNCGFSNYQIGGLLESHTLTGTLVREQNSGVTGGGSYKNVAVTFDNLTIEPAEKGVLTVSDKAVDIRPPQHPKCWKRVRAAVTFTDYGSSLLNGQSTIATTIATDVEGDSRTHTGTQATELPDGSSVLVTALSDIDCQAQVDIVADATAISFVDNYCFVALDF